MPRLSEALVRQLYCNIKKRKRKSMEPESPNKATLDFLTPRNWEIISAFSFKDVNYPVGLSGMAK